MVRPKYTITTSDVTHAKFYLSTRLLMQELTEKASVEVAKEEFREAVDTKDKDKRATRLNAWCEKYLDSGEWAKLKLAIRKRRERLGRHAELKTVTISSKAFELLAKISERDAVTYSDTLEHYLLAAFKGKARRYMKKA